MRHVSEIAAPLVTALTRSSAVVGILCFGSYVAGTQDQHSDIDLYVVCERELLPTPERQMILGGLSDVANLQLGHSTPGWDDQWAPLSDTLQLGDMRFELSYNTHQWLTTIVQRGTTEGAISLPELSFRPYTILGLLANSILLADPRGTIRKLLALLHPYPVILKDNILRHFLPIWQAEVADLRDCAERGIGNTAFLFHLWRACDALISILFALNEQYDPATKRSEQALARLSSLPNNFINRYEKLLEGPFTATGRSLTVQELITLSAELTPWPAEHQTRRH